VTSSSASSPGTEAFFGRVAASPQPLVGQVQGTIRFDVLSDGARTECWHVTVRKGEVGVSHDESDADTIVRIERGLFDDVTAGRANAWAAVLRGEVGISGNVDLLLRFQRVFPGPDGDRR
jgi:hypothetical protein